MAKQTISIVGAGLSGLTLSRCLLHRGIPTILYDRTSSPAPHSYGITLYASSYTPLLNVLSISESAFKRRVAVDTAIEGSGKINLDAAGPRSDAGSCFRANRGKLEDLLREGLDVRWDHKLGHVESHSDGASTLRFENKQTINTSNTLVIDASGPHSKLKKSLLPQHELEILPFVVFNGKRRIPRSEFDTIAPHMHDSNVLNFMHGDTRLNFSINEYTPEYVSVSWTYSRPSHSYSTSSDPLHKPDRELSDATKIPDELFNELSAFFKALAHPFAPLFAPEVVRKDRILHWLMRTSNVAKEDAKDLAKKGVVCIGDAAHATPIVGGNGANEGIEDAVSLAEWIANEGGANMEGWVEQRCSMWAQGVQAAEERIGEMHKGKGGRL
jgi:2-polyprenyl-6-methoxyphenol hydroxylase-like FAD-dependent oxidoreductase